MSTQLVPLQNFATHKRVWRRLVQTARLRCGIADYDNYVRHITEMLSLIHIYRWVSCRA